MNLAAIDEIEFEVSARDLWNSKMSTEWSFAHRVFHLNLITDKDGIRKLAVYFPNGN